MGKEKSKDKIVNDGASEQDVSRKVEFRIVNIDSHSTSETENRSLNWMEILEIMSFIVSCLLKLRYIQRYCMQRNRKQNMREASRLASAIAASNMITIPTTAITQTNMPVLQGAHGATPAITDLSSIRQDYSTWRD